jgi:hypothetical protein
MVILFLDLGSHEIITGFALLVCWVLCWANAPPALEIIVPHVTVFLWTHCSYNSGCHQCVFFQYVAYASTRIIRICIRMQMLVLYVFIILEMWPLRG